MTKPKRKPSTNKRWRTVAPVIVLLLIFWAVSLVVAVNYTNTIIFKPVVATSGVFLFWLVTLVIVLRTRQRSVSLSPLSISMLVWLLAVSFSFAFAAYPFFSYLRWSEVCTGVMFAWLVSIWVRQPRDISILAMGLVGLGVLTAVYGIMQRFDLSPFVWDKLRAKEMMQIYGTLERLRVTATFGHGTYFAGFLAMVIPLTVFVMFEVKMRWPRVILMVALLFMVVALNFTLGRTGFVLAVLGAIGVIGIQAGWRLFQTRRQTAITLIFSLLTAAVLFLLLPAHLKERFVSLLSLSDASAYGRSHIWRGSWAMLLERPMWGWGTGLFFQYFPRFRPPNYSDFGMEDRVTHAHNELLEIGAEQGITGMVLFLLLIGISYWQVWRIVTHHHGRLRRWALMFALVLSIIIADGLVSVNLRMPTGHLLFWFVLGGINALYQMANCQTVRSIPLAVPPIWAGLIVISGILVGNSLLQWHILSSDRELYKGWALRYQGRSAQAIPYLNAALAKNPYNLYAYYQLGVAHFSQENYFESLAAFEHLLQKSPYYPEAIKNIGLVYKRLNQPQQAIEYLERSLDQNATASTYFTLAELYRTIGDTTRMINRIAAYLPKAAQQMALAPDEETKTEIQQACAWWYKSGQDYPRQLEVYQHLNIDFVKSYIDSIKQRLEEQ